MIAPTPRRAHLRWIAVLATLLLVAGTGAASAYWTAQAQLSAAASAATIGIEQQLLPDPQTSALSTTYSAENLIAAGAVSIENTGSREATISLDVRAASPNSTGLTSALRVAIAPVASEAQCIPGAELAGTTTGALPLTYEGELAAGASIVLCVQTSLTPGDAAARGGEQAELTLASTLAYGADGAWTLHGPAERVMQHVEQPEKDPFADAEPMICSGNDWYVEMRFSLPSQENQLQGVEYRTFLAHEETPGVRTTFPARDLSAYHTTVQLPGTSVRPFVESEDGGIGNTWVYVEQRFAGDHAWTPAAVGRFSTSNTSTGDVLVHCGWQL